MSKPGAGGGTSLLKGYLILFNAILAAGWAYVGYLGTMKFLSGEPVKTFPLLWGAVEIPLKIFQTAAVMEVVHAAVRIVPSNVFLTLFQVLSRIFALWGVLNISSPSQTCLGVPLLLFAWTITEIIRYSYYVLHLVGFSKLIEWFRYTLFIVLYPIGVTGELICIYYALSFVRERSMWSIKMPNAFNLTFDYQYFLIGVMLMYIPFFPQLYCHMFAQRKKVLGGPRQKTNRD
jgi:very-long-chain (3R)-3-hydroxyacyl-CoA dehydratase